MSLGELAICEDFLDSHQEYAIDLLLSVKKLWVTGTERIAVLKRVKAGSVRYFGKGSTVTAGDSLRSQHAAWRARLAVMFSSSAQTPQQTKKLGRTASNLLGSEGRRPESNLSSPGSVSESTPSSTMFVVFTRCLSSDCPCEANKADAVQAQNPSRHHDLNSPGDRAPDTPSPLDAVLEENAPSRSTSETTSWTQETDPPSPKCDALIMGPDLILHAEH
ncbi:hypothetical protein L210DRAFT_3626410 [Boletus edulis BED1]|uniref:Uncharacterized protein n=1 Tax=Boletus edulis BED1 TaxID=1328754 RepID=A0AAD4C7U2_BOLED|nr:hypothetical protein L210DRAFT_3626410 [Boletus edulis BED1]